MSEVDEYIMDGYSIVKETNIYTFMSKKKFNWFAFLAWLFLTGIGALFYLIYYAAKTPKVVKVKNRK